MCMCVCVCVCVCVVACSKMGERMNAREEKTVVSEIRDGATVVGRSRTESESYLGPGVSLALIFIFSVLFLGLVMANFPDLDK